MPHSHSTKKGQTTIPIQYRKKYNLKEGPRTILLRKDEALLLRPAPDIADSAGALSKYATAEKALSQILRMRKESFR